MELIFEWDEPKARQNQRLHRISFEEAKSVFGDPFLMTVPDELHSDRERRFLCVGVSFNNRVLLVVHTEHVEVGRVGTVVTIRIISARKATASERKAYEKRQD